MGDAFLGVKLEIKPMVKIEDKNWSWHIGWIVSQQKF